MERRVLHTISLIIGKEEKRKIFLHRSKIFSSIEQLASLWRGPRTPWLFVCEFFWTQKTFRRYSAPCRRSSPKLLSCKKTKEIFYFLDWNFSFWILVGIRWFTFFETETSGVSVNNLLSWPRFKLRQKTKIILLSLCEMSKFSLVFNLTYFPHQKRSSFPPEESWRNLF